MSFNPLHELQELHIKYDHLWSFMHKILDILKEMEARNIMNKDINDKKILKKCKFFNTMKEEDAPKGSNANQDILIIVSIGRKEPASVVKNASICTLT